MIHEGQDSLVADVRRSEFQYFTGKFSGLWAGAQISSHRPQVNPDLHMGYLKLHILLKNFYIKNATRTNKCRLLLLIVTVTRYTYYVLHLLPG